MISLSPVVSEIVNSQNIAYFFLVTVGDFIKATNAPFDVVMSDGITYSSESGLLTADPPRYKSTVDRAAYKIMFTDAKFELKSYFEAGITGAPVSVRIGFFNTLGRTAGGVAHGDYFNSIDDTLTVYKGVVDSQEYAISFQDNTIVASIEGSSPMADLDLVRPYYTVKDFQKQFNANDTAFDYVLEGATAAQLGWGKV